MNKEKYEKIQMEVVELKEDIIVTSCPGDWGYGCNSVCGGDGGVCSDGGACSYSGIGNSTITKPTVCLGADWEVCLLGDMGTGCSPVSCSEESISPANP